MPGRYPPLAEDWPRSGAAPPPATVGGVDHFSRDGLTFDVTDAGPADAADVVVLLHGFPQDRSAWDEVTPALTAAGLRTLAPDQRGYSPNARPRGRRAYVMPELVADIVALLDDAGARRVHLVGHDWGGGVAWALAARHPERLASLTVLSTPHPAAMVWAMAHADQALHSWYMLAFQLPRLPERLLARRIHEFFRSTDLPEPHVSRYAARFDSPAALEGPLAWYRALPLARPGDAAGAYPRITVPTTYLWGLRDPALGRPAALRTAEEVRGVYRFVVLDAGHWLPETHPALVAEEILRRAREAGTARRG